jgi:hypothetical protein
MGDVAPGALDLGVMPALPRALTRVETIMLDAGARLDRFMMRRFVRRAVFPAPRDGDALRGRLERAAAFYADPRFLADPDGFFAPPTPLRAETRRLRALPDGQLLELRYASDFVPVFPEARDGAVAATARVPGIARWWRHDEPGRPAMLCVHGFGGGYLWLETLAFEAQRFYRAGLDVLIAVLPHHGPRAPGAAYSGAAFFDVDLVQTNEAFAQTIYELRALVRYLRAAGASEVGAFGMSLGGYTTALLASVEAELAFAVAMIPLTSLPEMMWAQGAGDARLERAVEHGWNPDMLRAFFDVHAPLRRACKVPAHGRLVIGALGDRICPPFHADALWRHWGRPRIHWYPGGHLAQFRRRAALREVRTLLREAGILPVRRPRSLS